MVTYSENQTETTIEADFCCSCCEDTQFAVGYIRVATKGQEEAKASLAAQRRAVTEYCKSNKYFLVRIFEDSCVSGSNLERQGLRNARAFCSMQREVIDRLIVTDLNRLSLNARDLQILSSELEQDYGIMIELTSERLHDSSVSRKAATMAAAGRIFSSEAKGDGNDKH